MNNIQKFKKQVAEKSTIEFKSDMLMLLESRSKDELAKFITILSPKDARLTIEEAYIIIEWVLENEEKTDILDIIENETENAEKRITSCRSSKSLFDKILNDIKVEMYKNVEITHSMLILAKKQTLKKIITTQWI